MNEDVLLQKTEYSICKKGGTDSIKKGWTNLIQQIRSLGLALPICQTYVNYKLTTIQKYNYSLTKCCRSQKKYPMIRFFKKI
jgi:hypothetical protein